MNSEGKEKTVLSVAEYLPKGIKELIVSLPLRVKQAVTEIRLRAGRPLQLTLKNESVFLSQVGQVCHLYQHGLYNVSPEEIEWSFRRMCEFSVYAYSQQIKDGYITLKNGCRVGIAASAVYSDGEIKSFCSVSSLNIRIANEYIGCASRLLPYLGDGLLIAGPPASGKTTLLRDAVRSLSYGLGLVRRRVSVIDTRGEIAAVLNSVPQNDVGPLTDVITSCSKSEGIEIALRTLNPEVIAFDEIGSLTEAEEVIKGFNAGADVLTTVHCGSPDELMHREQATALIKSRVVKTIAFVSEPGGMPLIFKPLSENGKITFSEQKAELQIG